MVMKHLVWTLVLRGLNPRLFFALKASAVSPLKHLQTC